MSSATTSQAPPAILDMEASGFGRNSYPIEVGYVLSDGSAFCTLIRPQPEWTHWDAQAEAVHGITKETTARYGRDVVEVARLMNQDLDGLTLYSDGWANDYTWLSRLYDAANMSPRFKLDNLRVLLTDEEADRWHAVKQEVALGTGIERHRASADAKLLQMTLQKLRSSSSP
jgi:hypothetical protein